MSALRTLLVLCLSAVSTSAVAQADREATSAGAAAIPDDLVAEEDVGVGARMRIPPPVPDPPLTSAVLQATLDAAEPDVLACLAGSAATVRARVSRDGELTLTVRVRPSDDAVEACVDTAARRRIVPLLSTRTITRAVRATLRVGRGTTAPPVPPVPPPVPPGPVDEAIVHARLDVATSALMRCLADAAPGVVGTVTLSVNARSDGTLVLEGVSMPPGVTAGPALVCMGDVVSRIRVPPGGGDRDVSHPISLGR